MLFVKFYKSVFMLHSICCKYHPKMVMLLLHIFTLCDIIAMHLFESYPKTDKIHHHKRPDLRDRLFFIFHLKYPYNRGICLALDFVMPLSLLVSSSSAYFYSAPFF